MCRSDMFPVDIPYDGWEVGLSHREKFYHFPIFNSIEDWGLGTDFSKFPCWGVVEMHVQDVIQPLFFS